MTLPVKSIVRIRVPVHPILWQCFDKRRGVFLLEKVSGLLYKGAFWPEISALGN